MKITMYVDLWPGLDPNRYGLLATSQPPAKGHACRRIAFDVTIPDSLLFEIDGHAAEVSSVREVQS